MKYEHTLMRPEVRGLYYQRLREMSLEEKLKMVSDLHETAKELVRAGVKLQYPHFSDNEVEEEMRRRMRR
jgi:hypothetical protein